MALSSTGDPLGIPNQELVEATVKAFPNPFTQSITLQMVKVTPADETDQVMLYSLDGRLIYQRSLYLRKTDEFIQLDDLPPLAAGMYVLKAVLNNQKHTFRMIRN